MTAKTTSEPQEDPNALPLTPELENVDITAVYRKGSIHTNFVVIFKRKDKDLILYMKPQRDKTRSELEKTLKTYSKNKILIEDLRVALESYIVEYFDQMCGIGSSIESEEFTENLNDNGETNPFDKYLDLDKNDQLLNYHEVTIEEAAQLHKGKIKFTGRIHSYVPKLFRLTSKSRWKCRVCDNSIEIPFSNILDPPRMPRKCTCSQTDRGFDLDNPEYILTRLLEVEHDDIARQKAPLTLSVYLLNEDSIDPVISSRVTIYGEIETLMDPRTKYTSSFVLAKRILYHDRQTLDLMPEDIPQILKLRDSANLPMTLAALFAKHLKGFEFEKFLVILSVIGSPTMRNPKTGAVIERGPMNLLFIGLPGCGKTAVGSEAVYLKPRSRDIHGENTTKATLCGMVENNNGLKFVLPGIAPLANGAVLFIDELDKGKDFVDGLLELTEHCTVTIGKQGVHTKFHADISIVATCNPRSENWQNKRKLELSDIPLPDRLISRFDLIIPIRELMTKEDWEAFSDFLLKRDQGLITFDYELLMKYIEYANRITHVTFDPKAHGIINEFSAKCSMDKDLAYITSKRSVKTIHRICATFARLYLSPVVTVEIAEKAIAFIKQLIERMNLNKKSFAKPQTDPLDVVMKSILKLNPSEQRAVDLTNHIQGLCQENKDLDTCIGMQDKPERRFKRNQNTTLDTLCHKITQDSRIEVTGSWKEKVYVIRELNEESQNLEPGRGGRGGRGGPFYPVNKKNIDIFDDETEIEKQATKELEDALSQSN